MTEYSFHNAMFKLLLLLSREGLTDDQRAYAIVLLDEIDDWQEFACLADSKMVAGFVYENLQSLGRSAPWDDIEPLRRHAYLTALRALYMRQELDRFHDLCAPQGKTGQVYFKGPLLADRYYDAPMRRYSRDIDVLVVPGNLPLVLSKAFAAGYRIRLNDQDAPTELDQQTLRALLKYRSVVSLISPGGCNIELHRIIDKEAHLFDPTELFASAVPYETDGRSCNLLPTSLLFIYLCYHNTRHIWSRLHWIADLDRIVQHESFDQDEVLALAEKKGLRPMVEACLHLNVLAAAPWDWDVQEQNDLGVVLLDLCRCNLAGDLELERALRSSYGLLGLPSSALVSPGLRRSLKWRHFVARLQPGFAEYERWPLPDHWQFLYRWTRFSNGLRRNIGDG